MNDAALWLMFSLYMFSGNHYIVGSIALGLSLFVGHTNR